jgi:hypothetical protein
MIFIDFFAWLGNESVLVLTASSSYLIKNWNFLLCFTWFLKRSLTHLNFFSLSTGWATDLKTVPDSVVKKRVLRTGDGTHHYSIEAKKNNEKIEEEAKNNNDGERDLDHFWGWGDGDMQCEDIKDVTILHKHYE